ncbi:putative dehydrogenase [Marmoricola sp. OAE513]|uniref:Gfo/Idh/MocA family protein n=1 Tax=Marmoricola sp. OAE513 TaxID=2817894 RepID=UPI001AE93A7D
MTRIGLVGTGYWARTVHATALAAHPGVELVGVYGRDLAKADAVAGEHGGTGYDDLDALLAEVDAVAFAVPPSVQGELALRAAEAGKHLFLEKPIALDLDVANALVDAVEDRDLSSVVFFTARYVDAWEAWLEETIAAAPVGGRADWLSCQVGPDNPYAASVWRRENGALWDVGPHQLAQLIPALGPVVDVAGARGEADLVHLVLTHESGATSRMSVGQNVPKAAVRVGVEFYGEDGWRTQPDNPRDLGQAYARALDELLANISAGQSAHRCDVRFGRDVVEVITRCEAVLTRPA